MNKKYSKSQLILIKRRREVRNKIITLISVSLLVLIVFFLSVGSKSVACSDENGELCKYYKSVKVTSESTVYDFANEYLNEQKDSLDSLVDEIMFINNLEDASFIMQGQYLIIPYYDSVRS